MGRVKKNVAANYAGSAGVALISLIFVPIYIKFMGIESYGLIGFFVSVMGVFSLLDLGLGATLNVHLARLSGLQGREQESIDLTRTIEVIYWCVGAIIGASVYLLAEPIAVHWVRSEHLTTSQVSQAVMLMGFAMALRWPTSLYSNGLIGLQKQVLANGVAVVFAIVRSAGAVLVLWLISPTIQAFFAWQTVAGGLGTATWAYFLWKELPRASGRARISKEALSGIWRFSTGMTGIGIVSFILTYSDKIILSKMLTLEMFGYYSLAWAIAGVLIRVALPVATAYFPRFSQLVGLEDSAGLRNVYHKACQMVSVVMLPSAMVIAFYSRDILLVWTGSAITAENAYVLLSFLIIGTAFNGLMQMPYRLQLAHQWTSLSLLVNTAAIFCQLPLLILMTGMYGALGAAAVWCIMNGSYVLIVIPLMHRRILRGEQWAWYGHDVGLPALGAFSVVLISLWVVPTHMSTFNTVTFLTVTGGLSLVAAVVAAPHVRSSIVSNLVMLIKSVWSRKTTVSQERKA